MRTCSLPGKLSAAFMMLFCIALIAGGPAAAQKKGGTLRLYHNDNPPSTSLLEESTIASVMPFAAVFNNLVTFDPAKVKTTYQWIVRATKANPSVDPEAFIDRSYFPVK